MNTPIVDFVKNYVNTNSLRLHMPGHKGNEVLGFEKYDITEIDGADVLYNADGIIAQSQKNATELFGTQATLYSTEGSSLCIRAMLYLVKCYAVQNGKKPVIFAGRNAHKTFVTAAALLNIDVDWIMPNSAETVISCVIDDKFLDAYLQNTKEKPTAVYVTSPDYLGNIIDIKALSAVCRRHNVLLIVDNAHGAYLKFLPKDIHPMSLGADMCCDSAHKTLPVLTGGAYLHISQTAPKFFFKNAQRALDMFASTSPSYLILQSIDAANKYMADGYKEELSDCANAVKGAKEALIKKGYTLCGTEMLKITLMPKTYGYTGCELSQALLKQKIVCEFADPDYITFMFTPQTKKEELDVFVTALCEIKPKTPIGDLPPVPRLSKSATPLSEVVFACVEKLEIKDCVGKISAATDFACPPAIPIVLPGERIDDRVIECFKYYNIKKWLVIK